MRLGLIARADNSGLGVQTHEFYKAMHPDKTLVMDISDLNGNEIFLDRYPGAQVVRSLLRTPDIDEFLQDLDVIFVAEAPYNYHLYQRAKELGVKTAVQYNYEFFDWFIHPDWPMPDLLIAPSKWHYNHVELFASANGVKHIYLHCPVNRDALPFREIRQARTFLHTGGRSAAHDRNGTKTVIEASALLQTDAKIVVHFQGEQGLAHQTTMTTADYETYAEEHGDLSKLTIVKQEFSNYADVYAMGDVLVLPRRYGGNCLPLNEALSVGLPAIMTDISPNNQFLPERWLVGAEKIGQFEPRTTIDIFGCSAKALARRIDTFYNMDEAQFMGQNVQANNIAERISWKNMEWQYRQAFEELCK
jgi:glycosyltransferase involved in cell wall biosynthesis